MNRSGNSQHVVEGCRILHELGQSEDLQLRTKYRPNASKLQEKGKGLIPWTSGGIRDEQVGVDRGHVQLFRD